MPLTSQAARSLRALAHSLKPLVHVGKNGVNDDVARAVGEALLAHELIKVKVLSECPITADEAGAELSEATRADVAQRIGRIVVLYKPHPKKPKIKVPKGYTYPPKKKAKPAESDDVDADEDEGDNPDDADVSDDE
jgi:RNA-binding protein